MDKAKISNILSQNQTKLRSKCCSVVLKKHSFWTMKNPTMKNNPGLFLEVTLVTLLSSAFLAPIFFLLPADTCKDEAQASSLTES